MSLSFPASSPAAPPSEQEIKLLEALCRSLNYRDDAPPESRFVWDTDASTDANVLALHEYFGMQNVARMRRGKKPDGILEFPMAYDLWSLGLVESSQFKRTCKAVGIPLSELTEQTKEERRKRAMERAARKSSLGGDSDGGNDVDPALLGDIDEMAAALENGRPSSADAAAHVVPLPADPDAAAAWAGAAGADIVAPPPAELGTEGEEAVDGSAVAGVAAHLHRSPPAAVDAPVVPEAAADV